MIITLLLFLIFEYLNNRVIESKKGFKLLNIADFHIGSLVTSLIPKKILDLPSGMPYRSRSKSAGKSTTTSTLTTSITTSTSITGASTSSTTTSIVSIPTTPRSIISSTLAPSTTSSIVLGSRLEKNQSSKSCLILGTADGGVGILLPIDERIYRRLALLQQIMYTTQPLVCSLNPIEYRSIKTSKQRIERKRGILDGNLLWTFINLEESLQDELAAAMGTTSDSIIENLEELDTLSLFF